MRLKRCWELVILCLMTAYDVSLHLVQVFGVEECHPLYPVFPSWQVYDIFWTAYWGFALILVIYALIKRLKW